MIDVRSEAAVRAAEDTDIRLLAAVVSDACSVIPQLSDREAATLGYARRANLGEIVDDWRRRWGDARRLAEQLRERVTVVLQSSCTEGLGCEYVETTKTQL